MLNEQPLLHFVYRKDVLKSAELLCYDEHILPFEFRKKVVNDHLLRCFFDARITPDTRIGLQEELEANDMPYYDPETLIRHQQGRCFDDDYWFKLD